MSTHLLLIKPWAICHMRHTNYKLLLFTRCKGNNRYDAGCPHDADAGREGNQHQWRTEEN